MILQCCRCDRSFDADNEPSLCPFCNQKVSFTRIQITTADGRELTYREHINDLRAYYKKHVPAGMTRRNIEEMDDLDLELMNDVMTE